MRRKKGPIHMNAQMFSAFRGFCLNTKAAGPNHMKGQMFIVTMVFLVGLIFAVQQLLFQYSYLDLPGDFIRTDTMIASDIEILLEKSITSSPTCAIAIERLDRTINAIANSDITGFLIETDYDVDCDNWDNYPPAQSPINLTIRISSDKMNSVILVNAYSTDSKPRIK